MKDPFAKERAEFQKKLKETKPEKSSKDELFDLVALKILQDLKQNPVKTPKKGEDYFTAAEIADIKADLIAQIPPAIPGKDAVVDYDLVLSFVVDEVAKIPRPKNVTKEVIKDAKIDIQDIVKKVAKLIPKQEIPEIDYEAIKELLEKRISQIPTPFIRGGANALGSLTDVDLSAVTQDAQGNYILGGGASLTVQDIDGTPIATEVSTIRFTNGAVTDDGGGQVTVTTGAGGGGDVSGPASSVDNTVARYDSTSGKIIQGSSVVIDDLNNITGVGTVDGRDVAADGTKLDGIEALADATDATNVTAAGALMDSEVDADIKTLSLPASTTISAFGASVIDDATAGAARTTLGVDAAGTDNSTDVTLAGEDFLSLAGQAITANPIDIDNLANGTDGEIITWDAAGAPAVVATGTANHVLTSNGAGAAPTFQAQSGGGTFETPTGTINGTNTVFTVTATPLYIIINGVMYFESLGYEISVLTVTMDFAPQTGSWIKSAS